MTGPIALDVRHCTLASAMERWVVGGAGASIRGVEIVKGSRKRGERSVGSIVSLALYRPGEGDCRLGMRCMALIYTIIVVGIIIVV